MNTTNPYVADILYMEMYNEVEIFYFKTFYLTIWFRPTLKDMMRVLYEASNPLTSGNIVAETKFAFQEGKLFPNKFRNIFFAETVFPIVFSQVFKCFQHEKHCFPDSACQNNFKIIVQT